VHAAPKIKLIPDRDKRRPYPLSWDEQARLFRELPGHLSAMALFAVDTGCRDGEICGLRWDWEEPIPVLETSVFIIPDRHVKNGEDRLVVLNKVARSIIDGQRRRPVKMMIGGITGWLDEGFQLVSTP
jgi:integrase